MDQFSEKKFTTKFRKDLRWKIELKLPAPLKSVTPTTMWKVTDQLHSFTAQLIQVKVLKNV